MARETKVGLLAGLAFIICFAVILANRGQERTIDRPLLQPVGGHLGMPQHLSTASPASSFTEHTNGVTNGNQTAASADQPFDKRINPAHVKRDLSVDKSEGNETHQAVGESPQSKTMVERMFEDPAADIPKEAPSMTDVTEPAWNTPPGDDGYRDAWRRDLENRLDELAAVVKQREGKDSTVKTANSNTPMLVSEPKSQPVLDTPTVHYKVAAGDTLSKIAAARYGTKSQTVVNAIFDANRHLLADPHELRIGMELVLPAANGRVPQEAGEARRLQGAGREARDLGVEAPPPVNINVGSPPSRGFQPARGSPPAKADGSGGESGGSGGDASRRSGFRWYQVRKDDRYVSIARQQLGDEGRWREIFDLNKDKFPDPGRIREGVRIKLPAVSDVNSGNGRS